MATVRAAPWCQIALGASWMMMLSAMVPASSWQLIFSDANAPGPTGNSEPPAAFTAPALPAPGPQLFVAPAGETKIGIKPAVAIATAARTEPNLGRRMPTPCFDWPTRNVGTAQSTPNPALRPRVPDAGSAQTRRNQDF